MALCGITGFKKKDCIMIIDCHGHYTTTPLQVETYRNQQRALLANDPNHLFEKGNINVSDDEIRDTIANNQLKMQQDRGTDVTIFSPRQAGWGMILVMPARHKPGPSFAMI